MSHYIENHSFTRHLVRKSSAYGNESNSETSSTVRWNNVKTGGDLGNYKKIIKGGGNASNNYAFVQDRVEYSAGFATLEGLDTRAVGVPFLNGGVITQSLAGCIPVFGAGLTFNPPSSGLQNQAISKLYSKLRSLQNPSDIAEDFGEMHQTLNQVRHPAKQLRDITLAAMRRNISILSRSGKAGLLPALAGSYLEWQFGVKPLCGTIANLYKELGLDEITLTKTTLKRFRVSARAEVDGDSIEDDFGEQFMTGSIRTHLKTSHEVGYVGAVRRGTSDSKPRNLGFTINNIIPTVYNCIPWTWAIDYVSNLDDMVESLSVPWSQVARCDKVEFSERRSVSRPYSISSNNFAPWWQQTKISLSPGSLVRTHVSKSRTVVESLPLPTFNFGSRMSGTQKMNLGAALVQVADSWTSLASKKLPILGFLFNTPLF